VSKNKSFIFQGKESFSRSKLLQIQTSFNQNNNLDADISSNEVYIVLSARNKINDQAFQDIFSASKFNEDFTFYVGPRIGTISPWSSKTEDIIKNVGFKDIIRVEKLFGFNIKTEIHMKDLDISMFFDRMTQQIYYSHHDVENLFISDSPRPLNYINLLEKGKEELIQANQSFGFAMSEQEIDYLYNFYKTEQRNPTDAELMMFAQANSEHCRHKIFNAKWNINDNQKNVTLFDLIKETSKASPNGIISAYKDNAAIISGEKVERLNLTNDHKYELVEDILNSTIKVETHNHPTAISPYPGASTGSGGEIRDEGATGRGAKPKIGVVGYNVSNLRIPQLIKPWEKDEHKPSRIASPLEIMIEAPIGAAAFNNEFGRPATLGYFRSFETEFDKSNKAFGYHKPIMLAGGVGEIRDQNNFKLQIYDNYVIVVLGGPSMLIGLGGGAASSVSSGESDEDLDFASVQRDNAEMERRCQEVINICSSQENSYIEFIHDVGAGGLSNAIPELAKDSDLGAYIELQKIPNADKSMSPMEIWSNESQERYVLAINKKNIDDFEKICKRERCEYAFVGKTTKEKSIKLYDEINDNYPVNVPLSMLFGDLPITNMSIKDLSQNTSQDINAEQFNLKDCLISVLRHPTVASKSFLITIGDRTVGGMVARDQFVGPYQVPVSNYSLSLRSFTSLQGEAVSIGEKPTLAIIDPAASTRMALGEAITNMAGVVIKGLEYVQVSANWMAACGENSQDLALRKGVESLSKICIDLNISVPVGKDSLSMRTKWAEGNVDFEVRSPLSAVMTAMSPVDDVAIAVTPELVEDQNTKILLIKMNSNLRLGGSIFSEITESYFKTTPDVDNVVLFKRIFETVQSLIKDKRILALHDISDGGLIISLLEMCFTKKIGMEVNLGNIQNINETLFSEEIGFVIQVNKDNVDDIINIFNEIGATANEIASLQESHFSILSNDECILREPIRSLEHYWRETSHSIQRLRDNPETSDSEINLLDNKDYKGLTSNTVFDDSKVKRININTKSPKIAILREQGVNGQNEMAAAFTLAGFEATDLHMQDLLDDNANLNNFDGLAVCGGFSYGDVLGAGGGWSKTILYNNRVNDQFEEFFNNESTFTLGVCNGCQMLSNLKNIIPGADHWPRFQKNLSDQFEARLAQVRVEHNDSVLLKDMIGWSMPVASAHGEGRAIFESDSLNNLEKNNQIALTFVDSNFNSTEIYPLNPNGSIDGVTGLTAGNGRITIMMPHPERVFRKHQMSWHPKNWDKFSPWMQMFINAKNFSKES